MVSCATLATQQDNSKLVLKIAGEQGQQFLGEVVSYNHTFKLDGATPLIYTFNTKQIKCTVKKISGEGTIHFIISYRENEIEMATLTQIGDECRFSYSR